MLDIYKYNKGMAKKKIFSAREKKLSSSLSSFKVFKEKLEKSKNIKLCKISKVWKDFERSIKESKEKLSLAKSSKRKFEILNIIKYAYSDIFIFTWTCRDRFLRESDRSVLLFERLKHAVHRTLDLRLA